MAVSKIRHIPVMDRLINIPDNVYNAKLEIIGNDTQTGEDSCRLSFRHGSSSFAFQFGRTHCAYVINGSYFIL